MNAPIKHAFHCSSRKPTRRHLVSGFPRALLCLSYAQKRGALGSRWNILIKRIIFIHLIEVFLKSFPHHVVKLSCKIKLFQSSTCMQQNCSKILFEQRPLCGSISHQFSFGNTLSLHTVKTLKFL